MGERAEENSAEREELCPSTENTAGCQQIHTPALQPDRPACLQLGGGGCWEPLLGAGGGGYFHLSLAGVPLSFGLSFSCKRCLLLR